ncbi:MAG: DNA-binding response regulator [Bacteroidota bacterium]
MNVLIVEDHPLTAAVYCNILHDDKNTEWHTVIGLDCKQGYDAIITAKGNNKPFDLAIIDYSLPSYPDKKLFSGVDVALLIKKNFPDCKLLMITSHIEILIIYDLIRKINPHGLVTKNDINTDNLYDIINDVLQGKLFKSPQIKACIKEVWTKDFIFDDYNRKILHYLSKGYRAKELEEVINLSGSAIQNRISKLKKAFNAKDDRELLRKVFEEKYL